MGCGLYMLVLFLGGFVLRLVLSDLGVLANVRRFEVLRILANGPMDVRGVARALGISEQAAGRHLRILCKAGFVECSACVRSSTLRVCNVYRLTPKGVRALRSVKLG